MKRVLLAAVTALLLCAVAVTLSPYVSAYQLKTAAEAQDADALAARIEFPSLRENIKQQLNRAMVRELDALARHSPMARIGSAFGAVVVDRLVDQQLSPAGLANMMRGGERGRRSDRELFENASMSYLSWQQFSIRLPSGNGRDAEFILSRRGMGWKLTNIILPISSPPYPQA